jgi:hypothetical protein
MAALGLLVVTVLPSHAQPPEPPPPPLAITRGDPAYAAARELMRWMRTRPEPRTRVDHSIWSVVPESVFGLRPQAECLADLDRLGVPDRLLTWSPSPRMPVPVSIEPPEVGGVHFRKTVPLPLVISCELAARLPVIAEVVARHGVTEVEVVSAYRATPASFHSVGLAIDLKSFVAGGRRIMVMGPFELTPGHPTCTAPPAATPDGTLLRAIACDLAATERFHTVLTPNYNWGHRDHFHLDIRPGDDRIFVR